MADKLKPLTQRELAQIHKSDADWLAVKLQEVTAERDLARLRLKKLRDALGYVQDGSSATVTIFQDDATMDFVVRVDGKTRYSDKSFEAVIDSIGVI